MTKSEIREKIFNAYANNLDLVAERYKIQFGLEINNKPELVDYPIYICPLCIKGFNIESLNQDCQNPLTIEDLPPRSVGGNPKILTCKACNNKSGHVLDHLIIGSLKTESFLKRIPNSEIASTIILKKGAKYKAIAKIDSDQGFRFLIQAKDSTMLKEHFKEIEKHWDGYTFNLNFQGPNPKKLMIAYLRIGLLLAYYYFGNRLIIEENYHKIRNHIIDPKNHSLPHEGVLIIPPSQNIKPGLHILKEPGDLRSYFITFQVKTKTVTKNIGIPFPGPSEMGWKRYSNFKNLPDTTFYFTDITSKEYIENKGFVDAYDYIYNNLK